MANTIDWGKATQNNTNGFGKYQNTINAGSIYGDSYAGETAIVGTSASFLYSKSSYNQGEDDPTPTITGTAGGSFNASANVVFVDTGTFNSSTGQIDLSATGIGSHIITYTVDGVQSGQTVGVTAIPYQSTSSFNFDGVNDYFDVTTAEFDFSGNFSVSVWAKWNATGYPSNSTGIIDFNKQSPSTKEIFIGPGFGSNFNNIFIQWDGNGKHYTGLSAGNDNWHNIIVTGTGTNGSIKTYLDGTEITTFSATSYGVTGGVNVIGKNTAFSGRYFKGNIDELSVWNTELSSSAVTEIYNSGAPNDLTSLTNASNTNLKAWYKL